MKIVTIKLVVRSKYCACSRHFRRFGLSYFLNQRANECHDQRFCKIVKFVHICVRENWVIYRNSIVRVKCTNVPEKFLSSNSVANQIKLCIESTLQFAANRF